MIYVQVTNCLDYIDEDGYGPLDHQSASRLAEYLNLRSANNFAEHLVKRLTFTDLDHLVVGIPVSVAPPDLLIPQESDLVLISEPLLSQEHVSRAFVVLKAVDVFFAERAEAKQFYLCESALTNRNSNHWIDFSRSIFAVAKSISLGCEGLPRIVEADISFSSGHDHEKKSNAQSILRRIVPHKLSLAANEFPAAFRWNGCLFFGGELLNSVKSQKLLGLTTTGTSCEAEKV